MEIFTQKSNAGKLQEAVNLFRTSTCAVALTGAGISVNSGIADFRSPGGVWTRYSPDEYATLDVFLHDPEKAWVLYRELGKELFDKKPNKGHKSLATLEQKGLLRSIITQNVDNLHQMAGNSNVIEIHGDHQHLQCLECGSLELVRQEHFESPSLPTCNYCSAVLKPNVVLFGEAVRNIEGIQIILQSCDLLLVIGTSASVYPAAGFPDIVKQRGGLVYEFNLESSLGQSSHHSTFTPSDYLFKGDLSTTLPFFTRAVLETS